MSSSCPYCGYDGNPCFVEDDVQVVMNWQELRILTIWAMNYAQSMREGAHVHARQTVQAIVIGWLSSIRIKRR